MGMRLMDVCSGCVCAVDVCGGWMCVGGGRVLWMYEYVRSMFVVD